jgi:hypothetical protein
MLPGFNTGKEDDELTPLPNFPSVLFDIPLNQSSEIVTPKVEVPEQTGGIDITVAEIIYALTAEPVLQIKEAFLQAVVLSDDGQVAQYLQQDPTLALLFSKELLDYHAGGISIASTEPSNKIFLAVFRVLAGDPQAIEAFFSPYPKLSYPNACVCLIQVYLETGCASAAYHLSEQLFHSAGRNNEIKFFAAQTGLELLINNQVRFDFNTQSWVDGAPIDSSMLGLQMRALNILRFSSNADGADNTYQEFESLINFTHQQIQRQAEELLKQAQLIQGQRAIISALQRGCDYTVGGGYKASTT